MYKIFDLLASIKKHTEELIMVIFRFKLYKRMEIWSVLKTQTNH